MKLTIKQALQKGITSHKEGKLQEAEKYYRAVISCQARHPDANHNLGVVAIGAGKVEKALTYFKVAVESNPKQGQFWLSYIEALIKNDRMDHARQVLKQGRALGLKGQKADALENKLSQSSAANAFVTGNNKLSNQQIDNLISLYNCNNFRGTIKQGDILSKQFPNDPNIPNILGAAYSALGRYKEAIASYDRAIELKPNNAEAYNNMGSALKTIGNNVDAIASFNTAIKLKPDFVEANYNLGNVLKHLNRHEAALTSYNKAIDLRPDYAEAHYNLGNI